ncbi:hypothetical protein PIB30_013141 [Stylosanthes scabra]|uniref:Uncharacterized protein n=1 Tax=Stylosanthes scabra TaxID=79078 RepID=A0ABU6X625_9FABA|nr:hypothetical protein [Stylosanthes scabra]
MENINSSSQLSEELLNILKVNVEMNMDSFFANSEQSIGHPTEVSSAAPSSNNEAAPTPAANSNIPELMNRLFKLWMEKVVSIESKVDTFDAVAFACHGMLLQLLELAQSNRLGRENIVMAETPTVPVFVSPINDATNKSSDQTRLHVPSSVREPELSILTDSSVELVVPDSPEAETTPIILTQLDGRARTADAVARVHRLGGKGAYWTTGAAKTQHAGTSGVKRVHPMAESEMNDRTVLTEGPIYALDVSRTANSEIIRQRMMKKLIFRKQRNNASFENLNSDFDSWEYFVYLEGLPMGVHGDESPMWTLAWIMHSSGFARNVIGYMGTPDHIRMKISIGLTTAAPNTRVAYIESKSEMLWWRIKPSRQTQA